MSLKYAEEEERIKHNPCTSIICHTRLYILFTLLCETKKKKLVTAAFVTFRARVKTMCGCFPYLVILAVPQILIWNGIRKFLTL